MFLSEVSEVTFRSQGKKRATLASYGTARERTEIQDGLSSQASRRNADRRVGDAANVVDITTK